MKKSTGAAQFEPKDTSESDDKYSMAEFRKENERLQKLIAKKQVAHESEINKIRAEHAEEIKELAKVVARNITIGFVGNDTHKSSCSDAEKPLSNELKTP